MQSHIKLKRMCVLCTLKSIDISAWRKHLACNTCVKLCHSTKYIKLFHHIRISIFAHINYMSISHFRFQFQIVVATIQNILKSQSRMLPIGYVFVKNLRAKLLSWTLKKAIRHFIIKLSAHGLMSALRVDWCISEVHTNHVHLILLKRTYQLSFYTFSIMRIHW